MPLSAVDRQPLVTSAVDPDKLKCKQVFYLKETQEIFTDHTKYCDRLLSLEQKTWMCAISFKKGLTYSEAQSSEERLAQRVSQLPVPIHRALCCLVVNFGPHRVDRLVNGCFNFLEDKYLIGEPVVLGGKNTQQPDATIESIRIDGKKSSSVISENSDSDDDISQKVIDRRV